MSVDALGNPLPFILTGAHAHDVVQGPVLLDRSRSRAYSKSMGCHFVIADKGYDSGPSRQEIRNARAEPVISYRRNACLHEPVDFPSTRNAI